MSDADRATLPPPRSHRSRSIPMRPYYGRTVRPARAGKLVANTAAGVLGALGGTLGCLLCLAAVGALGLFSCVVAITSYARQFLDVFRSRNGTNGAEQLQTGSIILFASLFYTIVYRIQRN